MTTLHFHQNTTSTPAQFIEGLTDFGPGRSEVFPNSADEYLRGPRRPAPTGPTSPRARRAPGSGCTTTGRTPTASSSPPPTPTRGVERPDTPTR